MALLLALWTVVTVTGLVNHVFLPAPWVVVKAFWELLRSGQLAVDVWKTLQRTLAGFIAGAAIGALSGFAMGTAPKIYEALEFPLDFFRSIPATALFPLFIVLFGLGAEVKIFVALWTTAMVVAVNTLYGTRSVAVEQLEVARLKRVSYFRRFRLLVIPSAAPYVIAGARIGLSLALVVEIVAEMFLGSDSGLGRTIYNASTVFDMEQAYAGVVALGIVGYLLNRALAGLERWVVYWRT